MARSGEQPANEAGFREKVAEINYKMNIILSYFLQAVLQFISTKLANAGNIYEFWQSLRRWNGNPFSLWLHFWWLNVIRRNKVEMLKEFAKYLSTHRHLDRRTDLDKNIKPGDKKYLPQLAVAASNLAYEDRDIIKSVVEDQWKMEFLGPECDFWNEYQQRESTGAIIVQDRHSNPNMIVVAFRGTVPFCSDDWITDVDLTLYQLEHVGQVHRGFMKALGLQKDQTFPRKIKEGTDRQFAYYYIKKRLKRIFKKNSEAKFIVTGHSLGGALAVLFPAILGLNKEAKILERLEGIYTFGQPKVGDEKFGRFVNWVLEEHRVKYHRFVYYKDMVCRMPFDITSLKFKHFGNCIHYNSTYEGKLVSEEPQHYYFMLFVFWSGLTSHAIERYINSIRLGTADFFA